jgi:hypothetical protein
MAKRRDRGLTGAIASTSAPCIGPRDAVAFLNNGYTGTDTTLSGGQLINSIDFWMGGLASVHVFTGQSARPSTPSSKTRWNDGWRPLLLSVSVGRLNIDPDLGHTSHRCSNIINARPARFISMVT